VQRWSQRHVCFFILLKQPKPQFWGGGNIPKTETEIQFSKAVASQNYICTFHTRRRRLRRMVILIWLEIATYFNLFEFQEYAEDTFVSFLVSRLLRGVRCWEACAAERRALLSLHLHFVAQFKFFVIIIIIIIHLFIQLKVNNQIYLYCPAPEYRTYLEGRVEPMWWWRTYIKTASSTVRVWPRRDSPTKTFTKLWVFTSRTSVSSVVHSSNYRRNCPDLSPAVSSWSALLRVF